MVILILYHNLWETAEFSDKIGDLREIVLLASQAMINNVTQLNLSLTRLKNNQKKINNMAKSPTEDNATKRLWITPITLTTILAIYQIR